MPEEEYAPPVVAVVVVTGEAGESVESCIESLAGQDYPSLDVLVVDAGAGEELAPRVAAVMPGAFVRRRESGGGYAGAANDALSGIEGASFYLFCRGDAVLYPDAVRKLVEESFRSNAGIVGPKLIAFDAPDHLLEVGLGVTRLGRRVPRIEEGELDQSQHDEVREVFAVSDACLLARVDLFAALRGFDEDMGDEGADVDLCWRAHAAGARVVVVPEARVCVRQSNAERQTAAGGAHRERRASELRAVLKNYGAFMRFRVTVQLVLLTLIETLTAPLTGRRLEAHAARAAWRWNFAHRASLSEARLNGRASREAGDREVVSQMARKGRFTRNLRVAAHGSGGRKPYRQGAIYAEVDRVSDWALRIQHGEIPSGLVVTWVLVVAVVLVGTRSLLFGSLPIVGDLVPGPNAHHLLSWWIGGKSDPGWLGTEAASPAFGVIGLLGTILGNSSALALKFAYLSGPFIGAIGMSRLLRDFGSGRSRAVAAVGFIASPLVWNSLATGDLGTSVALAGLPFVFGRLARASGLRPFASAHGRANPSWRMRSLVSDIAPLGLLFAVLIALSPAVVVDIGVVIAGTALASVIVGGFREVLRSVAVGFGALVVAFGCCLPWSVTLFQSGARWSLLTGAVRYPGAGISAANALRGATGPVGHFIGAFGLVVAASVVLIVARGPRLTWAVRWWVCAVGAVCLAWVGSQGWLGSWGGDAAVLSVPAAVGFAACCGIGLAAFELDVSTRTFGWRQATGVLAAVCFAAGLLPALSVIPAGRAGLPAVGFDEASGELSQSGGESFRVLWLGDPQTLPGSSMQIAPGLSAFVTTTGLPSMATLWQPLNPGPGTQASSAVVQAEQGGTLELGSLLAPYGIRDIVIPTAEAPVLIGVQSPPAADLPPDLLPVLRQQSDLRELPTEDGVVVFQNVDWGRVEISGALPSASTSSSAVLRGIGSGAGLVVILAAIAEGFARRRRQRLPAGPAGANTGGEPEPSAASVAAPEEEDVVVPDELGPVTEAEQA